MKPLRFLPVLQAIKRNGPAVFGRACGMSMAADSKITAQLWRFGGVRGLRAGQAIRKALHLSDSHFLWLCSPYKGTSNLGLWCPPRQHPPERSERIFWKLLNGSFQNPSQGIKRPAWRGGLRRFTSTHRKRLTAYGRRREAHTWSSSERENKFSDTFQYYRQEATKRTFKVRLKKFYYINYRVQMLAAN